MTLDRAAMLTPDGKERLQAIYDAAPSVPWTVGPDEHLRIINDHLQRGLLDQFAGAQRPRKPAMSAATWRLLLAKRQQRRIHRRRAALHTRWLLLQCMRAWQGHSVASPHAHVRRQKAFDYVAAAHVARMQQIAKELRRAHQADEAEFVRLTYQDCRLQGPAALAKKLRSVLRSGRRAIGGVPTSLQTNDGPVTDHNLVLQHFGKHFAKAEQASTVELALMPSLPCDQLPSVCIGDAPAIADVCGAFASLKSGKATGISGIPPEAYSACAAKAALLHMPLMLKSLSRGRLPLLWTGLKAHPIPKPSKLQDRVEGYRSIALAEPAGKAVTKAARRGLVTAFEKITVPTVGGARPDFPVEVPALAVQAHLAMLRSTKRPGAAIFIDGISAFYAARRAHLFTTDAAALHSHITSLALDDDVRQRVCRAVEDCGALERAHVPDASIRLLKAAFTDTWFSVDLTDSEVYRTTQGTVPGSPMADLLFQFIAEVAIRCLQQHLDNRGISAVIRAGDKDIRASPQSWLDDVTLLLTSPEALQVQADVAEAMRLIHQYFAVLGIGVNFSAGKTETIMCWHGPGSTKARAQVMVELAACIPVVLPDATTQSLRCVDDYVHLGNLRGFQAAFASDVKRRGQLARDVYRPFQRRILCNTHLSLRERQNLLAGMILAKFMHGAGTWAIREGQNSSIFSKTYMSFLRGSVRPLHGVPCRRLNEAQICALTGALTPGEALAVQRVRLLSQLSLKADSYLKHCLALETTWLQAVATDLRCIADVLDCSAIRTYLAEACCTVTWVERWPFDKRATANMLRKFRRACLARRDDLIPAALAKARAHDQVSVNGLVFITLKAGTPALLSFKCNDCGRAFSGAARLAVHRAKKHAVRALATEAWGTACEICRRQYWSTDRLKEHFRRSPSCAFAYQQAEIGTLPRLQMAPNATPPVPLVGPSPWWATLRPTVEQAPAPCNQMPDATQLLQLAQVPTYAQQWLSMVEQGIAWRSNLQNSDWARPIVQLTAHIVENAFLDAEEHFFAVGGLATVYQGARFLLGPEKPLREARGSYWPDL